MKWFLLTAISLCFSTLLVPFNKLYAQKTTEKNMLPPFRILLTNMQYLKAAELDKNSSTVIVYFDPTCDHCKTFTTDLLKYHNELSKTQIIMISYTPIAEVKTFETEFNLTKYPNFKIGTEGTTFIVRYFYNIEQFPFVALHDKKGMLVATYKEPSSANELVQKIKKI